MGKRVFQTSSRSKPNGGARGERVSGGRAQPEAAAAFDRIAATVDAIRKTFSKLFRTGRRTDGLLDVERWTEMLRDVGFNSAPETAEDSYDRSLLIEQCEGRNWQFRPGRALTNAPCPTALDSTSTTE